MAKTTTDHKEIRRWVTERGGFPARVKGTEKKGGVLRIDYPGFSGEESLEAITWTEFFNGFENNRLAFLYEDEPQNRFSKLIERKGKGH
ncbi:MAG TPA: hypothetical protein VE863_17865 [Pyrinomonadaceae bacterium]|jgi:hypothetical protein|nr:hypothetical protein [Pyrinomonadaceae bacterium]